MSIPGVRRLMAVDVASMVQWISAIPFEEWPQQHRLEDGKLRPAMVNEPGWRGFGEAMAPVMARIMDGWRTTAAVLGTGALADARTANPMLSVVMPGHSIPPHADHQQPGWITRIHVPLLTNPWAFFDVLEPERSRYQMAVGQAYLVDVTRRHEVHNNGLTPRVHFMFDVMGKQPIPASER